MRVSSLLFILFLIPAALAQPASEGARLDQQVRRNTTPLAATQGLLLSYADVVEQVRESVVTIEIQVKHEDASMKAKSADDDFDLRQPADEPTQEDKEEQVDGSGTGIVLTTSGLILTNNHVVEHAENVRVRPRGAETALAAEIVGRDPLTDVALLRVTEKAAWSPATLGDSSLVRVGDVALALGSPFGLDQTLTSGVISATGRSRVGGLAGAMEDFIQTDAAINPGNSGGPLMDARGRVVGMNTLKHRGDNIGFAVPMNLALKIATDLAENGRVVRGYLGVRVVPVTSVVSKAMGLKPGTKGVAIDEVTAGSAALAGGLLPEDVIMQVNQFRIDGTPRFHLALAMLRPGDAAQFVVMRKGVQSTLKVTLGLPPDMPKPGQPPTRELAPGLFVGEWNESLRKRFAVPDETEGLVVVKNFGSIGSVSEIRAGELLLSVNGETVLRLADLPASSALKGKTLRLMLRGKAGEHQVAVGLH